MNAMPSADLPVAIIGAVPVGLAAAARLVERGLRPALLEKGRHVGAAILNWGQVRVFSLGITTSMRRHVRCSPQKAWLRPPATTCRLARRS